MIGVPIWHAAFRRPAFHMGRDREVCRAHLHQQMEPSVSSASRAQPAQEEGDPRRLAHVGISIVRERTNALVRMRGPVRSIACAHRYMHRPLTSTVSTSSPAELIANAVKTRTALGGGTACIGAGTLGYIALGRGRGDRAALAALAPADGRSNKGQRRPR